MFFAVTAAVLALGGRGVLALPSDLGLSPVHLGLFAERNAQPLAMRVNGSTCTTSNGADPSTFSPPLYREAQRPQIHFSPSSNFMNDPNGLVFSNGTYHLYYQYNPTHPVAGNQHWGHATSTDLYHWENHAPAIAPESANEGIFSGSAVVDFNNTSGWFSDDVPQDSRIVAIYTLNTASPASQTQNVAYSHDGGLTFTKYRENPVIDIGASQFRDPKVFWDEDHERWVMAVVRAQEYVVVFYTSPNLKDWTEQSRFSTMGLLGYQYECPDLFTVRMTGGKDDGKRAHVLVISLNPGAPLGGSVSVYFIGDWDGEKFTPKDGATRIVDWGKEYYAAQTYNNVPGRTIQIGWANNWQYTNVAPTSPWRSIQSVPRELRLQSVQYNPETTDYVLAQEPVDLSPIGGPILFNHSSASGSLPSNHSIALKGESAFDIRAVFATPATANTTYNSTGMMRVVSKDGKNSVTWGMQAGEPAAIWIDRSEAGKDWAKTNPFFNTRFSTQVPNVSINSTSTNGTTTTFNTVELRALIDRSVLELFVNGGVQSAVANFWMDDDAVPAYLEWSLGDTQVQLRALSIQALERGWNC